MAAMILNWNVYVFLAVTCFLFAWLGHEIEQRRRIQQKRDYGREGLGDALRTGQAWSWEWNPVSDEFSHSKEAISWPPQLAEVETRGEAFQHIHPEDRDRARVGLLRAFSNRLSYQDELRCALPDGSVRWFALRARFLPGGKGAPARMAGIHVDITKNRQAEIEMATLAHIVQSSQDAILTTSLEGNILSWNPRAEAMYGYASHEAIGRSLSMLAPAERTSEMSSMMTQLVCGNVIQDLDTEHVRNDHQRIPVMLAASPVRDRDGRIVSISITARDATERKRAEAALCQAEKLSAAGRMAATIAHEINNPIGSVLNALYLLEQQSLTQQASAYLAIANREALRIAHIVRQTLGLVRESATPTLVDVSEILEDVLSLYQGRIRKNGVRVVRRYDVPGEMVGFPGELRQIFSNLVINAVEAMGQGGDLTLHIVRAHDLKLKQPGLRVFVADAGPGIDPAHRNRMFEPFFTTKGENGTGLGLWVTQGLIAKHAGSIRMRSCTQPGKSGTCFAVFLPNCSVAGSSGHCREQAA
jgi:PAS domain S-box-containing protein